MSAPISDLLHRLADCCCLSRRLTYAVFRRFPIWINNKRTWASRGERPWETKR